MDSQARSVVLAAFLMVVTLGGCGSSPAGVDDGPADSGTGDAPAPTRLRVEVLEVLPHDTDAFTQGFELVDGTLYEGTGRVGESRVTAADPGERPHTTAELAPPLFGEGITVVEDTLWQLTWKAGVAVKRDRASLEETDRLRYEGQGWGLCHQSGADRMVMSDGSDRLTFRDPHSFAARGTVSVHAEGEPVTDLNELECAGEWVYANVWQRDEIVRIDPSSGRVDARIDASGLLTSAERDRANVLNGIAAVTGTDRFLITGKLWPKTFRVRFVADS